MNRASARHLARFAPLLLAAIALAACQRKGGKEGDEAAPSGASDEKKEPPPFSVEHAKDGTAIVVLAPEAFAAAGIATTSATTRELAAEVAAYGTLVADGSRVGVLRAPLAGTLVGSRDAGGWPVVGARVAAGAPIGALAARVAPLTPAERADVDAKLAAARADALATQGDLAAATTALERAKKLNAQEKGVADQVVEAAAAAVTAGQAKLDAARATVAIFERLASASARPAELPPLPLVVPLSGEVVAVLAQPGESVEAGQELARFADFDELFADVRLPLGAALPTGARVVANGDAPGAPSCAATIVGPAPEGDALAPTLRLRVKNIGALRPGRGVTAWLAQPGAPRQLVALPASAVVRYASRSWVWIETEERRFERRAITIARVDGDALLVADGVEAGAKVVSVGAMTLLSQEQLAAGGAEGGD